MNTSVPAPRSLERGAIPNLWDVQFQLTQAFLDAAVAHELSPVLSNCFQTPRLGFDLPASKPVLTFLQELLKSGWSLEVIDSGLALELDDLSVSPIDVPNRLLLFKPVFYRGRLLHGAASGLRIALVTGEAAAKVRSFPCKPFDGYPVNDILAGRRLRVKRDLIEQVEKGGVPSKVDIVYTWVDGDDEAWRARRAKHNPCNPSADAAHKTRFENNNELLFSLRSLFRYFNGIGRVYVVTDAQTPTFIDEFEGRVTIVDHSEIMGPDVARPCFNSHVIESCLHKIDGLAEHYLYLNDDFLFAKPTCPADFFDQFGRAKAFYSRKAFIPKGDIHDRTLAVDAAAINLRRILKERFDHPIHRKFQHTPVAMLRHVMFEIEEVFAEDLAEMRKNQFRARNDLSPSGSLYLHYAIMKGYASTARIQYRYYDTSKPTLALKLTKLSWENDRQRPKVHCINATGNRSMTRLTRWIMQHQLGALYPDERDTRARSTGLDKAKFRMMQSGLGLRARYRRALRQQLRRLRRR